MKRIGLLAAALLAGAALVGCDRDNRERQIEEMTKMAVEEAARAKEAAAKALPEDVKQRLKEAAEAAKAGAEKALQQAGEKVDELRNKPSAPTAPENTKKPPENAAP